VSGVDLGGVLSVPETLGQELQDRRVVKEAGRDCASVYERRDDEAGHPDTQCGEWVVGARGGSADLRRLQVIEEATVLVVGDQEQALGPNGWIGGEGSIDPCEKPLPKVN